MAKLNVRHVLKNDTTANWKEKEKDVLLKGEPAVEFTEDGKTRLKFGDGTTSYGDIKYFGQGTEEAVAEAKKVADAAVVANERITGGTHTKITYDEKGLVTGGSDLTAEDIPNIGMSKVTGLSEALGGKQDNVVFNTAYDAGTNKAATMQDVSDAANGALTEAKSYADGLVGKDSAIAGRVTALEGKVDVESVSGAISAAKSEAVAAAKTETTTQVGAAKTAILGAENYEHTVKDAYDLASGKATMAEVEAKDYATKTEAKGYADAKDAAISAAKSAADAAQDTANAKVASVGATPAKGIEIGGTATDPTVGIKLDPSATNAATLGDDGLMVTIPEAVKYTIEKAEDSGDYAAVYTLKEGGVTVGVPINIPKDMVVKSGSVVENPKGQPTGTYIELVLANASEDKIYINVAGLIEYVTSGSAAGDMVVVAVDEITHKVTATLTDGTVTKAKLAAAVQTSLGKADSALQPGDAPGYGDILTKTAASTTYVAKETGKRLMTNDEGEKLAGIADGAEVNKIDAITVAGANVTVTGKTAAIPGATATVAGAVKGSAAENAVAVQADFTMLVNSLNVNKLVQTDGDYLILDGGSASI